MILRPARSTEKAVVLTVHRIVTACARADDTVADRIQRDLLAGLCRAVNKTGEGVTRTEGFGAERVSPGREGIGGWLAGADGDLADVGLCAGEAIVEQDVFDPSAHLQTLLIC